MITSNEQMNDYMSDWNNSWMGEYKFDRVVAYADPTFVPGLW